MNMRKYESNGLWKQKFEDWNGQVTHCRVLADAIKQPVSGYSVTLSCYSFARSFIEAYAGRCGKGGEKMKERLMNTKSIRGNYKGTRDHGKTRVPANSVFPVYEGKLRSNEVTVGTTRVKGKNRALIKIKAQVEQFQRF